MKHDWKRGWKEIKHRKGFVDVCKKCGIGHFMGLENYYIAQEDVTKFLTTAKFVLKRTYKDCNGKEDYQR